MIRRFYVGGKRKYNSVKSFRKRRAHHRKQGSTYGRYSKYKHV